MLVVKVAELAVIADVASAGGLVSMMVFALRRTATGVMSLARSKPGKVAAAGFVVVSLVDDDFRKGVLEFLSDFGNAAETLGRPLNFAWGAADRMQRFGPL